MVKFYCSKLNLFKLLSRGAIVAGVVGLSSGCVNSPLSWQSTVSSLSSSNGGNNGGSASKYQLIFGSPWRSGSAVSFGVGTLVSPPLRVNIEDLSGNTVTSGSYTVNLNVYNDSACTQQNGTSGNDQNSSGAGSSNPGPDGSQNSNGNQNSTMTAISSQGVALFSHLSTTQAGTYYLQASANYSNSSQMFYSNCSQPVIFTPGPAVGITSQMGLSAAHSGGGNPSGDSAPFNSPYLVPYYTSLMGPSPSPLPISVQVIDSYGNAVGQAGVPIIFSAPSYGAQSTATNSQGVASAAFSAPLVAPSGLPRIAVIQASASGLSGASAISTSVAIPIYLQAGPASQMRVSKFPATVFSGSDSHWLEIQFTDFYGNATSYQGAVTASGASFSGGTTSVIFDGSEEGDKWVPVSIPSSSPSSFPDPLFSASPSNLNGILSTMTTGPVGLPFTTIQALNCGTPNRLNQAGDWSSSIDWMMGTLSGSQTALISSGLVCTLSSQDASAQASCLEVAGQLNLSSGGGVSLGGSQFLMDPGSFASDASGALGISFKPGQGAQEWVNNSGSAVLLPNTVLGLPSPGPSYSFFMLGEGQEFLNLNIPSNGPLSSVYIDSPTTILSGSFTIPSGAHLIVDPGGILDVEGGVTIGSGGVLEVRAGGQLLIGNGKTLLVNNGGTLNLLGSNWQNLAWVGPSNFAKHFSFAVSSGGALNASYFVISGTDSLGLLLSSGSTAFVSHGVFENIAPSGVALTLENGISWDDTRSGSSVPWPFLIGLHFFGQGWSPGFLIDASNNFSAVALLSAYYNAYSSCSGPTSCSLVDSSSSAVTGQASSGNSSSLAVNLKNMVNDPNQTITWDY